MRQNIAALLAAVLFLSLCAGCGASGNKGESAGTESAGTSGTVYVAYDGSTAAEEETEEKEERVLVVYCIGEDFKNRVQDFYPDYEVSGEDSGMIGDVRVEWHVYTDAQEYREDLDERLELAGVVLHGVLVEDLACHFVRGVFLLDACRVERE